MQESIQSIGSSFRKFFTGTLFSRITGFAREVAMASLFGITPEIAAFWMAFRFAHILRRLFGEGGLHVAFVPHFEGLKKNNPQDAYHFFMGLSLGLGTFLVLLGLIIEAVLGGLLIWGNLEPSSAFIVRLTFLMLPSFIFVSLYSLNASFLQCEKSYFLPSIAPVFLNIIWVLSLPFLPKKNSLALECLALVVVLGLGFKWFITWISVLKSLKGKISSIKWLKTKEYIHLLKPFSLALIGVAATQINTLCDSIFARFASPDGPAVLWYALRLEQLPLALVGVGVSAAFFPPIARAASEKDGDYNNLVQAAISRAFICMIPITFACFTLGFSSVNFVYGRGAFTEEAIRMTTLALFGYGVGLLPSTLVFILASSFYARKNYRIPTLISILTVLLNLALNALFVFGVHMGAISIALSTSLAASINALLLALLLRREIGSFGKGLFSPICRITLASLSAACITLFFGNYLFKDNSLPFFFNHALNSFPKGIFEQSKTIGFMTILFFSFFFGSAYLLKCASLFETILPRRLQKIFLR